jgi:hypothetical protein
MTDNGAASSTTPSTPSGLPKGAKTIGFFAILVGVLGLFTYLSTLEAPPDLPKTDVHKLRFNNDNELIGLGTGEIPTVDAAGQPLSLEKKAIEGRVNQTCAACHGTPQMLIDGTGGSHSCNTTPGKCLPEHHPPKETCIKCHRTAK